MDRRTLLYIALCFVFLVAYQWWVHRAGWDRPRTPPAATAPANPAPTPPAAGTATPTPGAAPSTGPAAGATLSAPPPATPSVLERTTTVETPLYRATFTNRGARLLSIELKRFRSAGGPHEGGRPVRRPKPGEAVPAEDRVALAGGPAFALDLGADTAVRSLDATIFTVEDSADAAGVIRRLAFTAHDSAGTVVREVWHIHPETYALDLDVDVQPGTARVDACNLTVRSWPTFTEANRRSDDALLRATSFVGTNYHRDGARDLARGRRSRYEGNVRWVAVQSRYFIGAIGVRQAPVRAVLTSGAERPLPPGAIPNPGRNERPVQNVAAATLVSAVPGPGQPAQRYVVYFGPTDYDQLARLGADLERAVDLGWAWLRPISHVLLVLLQWIERFVRNWGVAIVVLATLVRLVLHPLNLASMRSMRAMQRLQPEMERLKQKYKNDPQTLNTSIMALYRENKVNPAGGCLPMLLQMPIFFALYAVLSNAIALRQAPFVGWIDDLSSPDLLFTVSGFPVRLLPVLMAATGYLQQRLTPMSPQQAPSAWMMNVMMLVLFYNAVPSGLVLYWTVMNVFTLVQQWMVLRHDAAPSSAVVVEAAPPRRSRARGASGRP